MEEGKLSRAYSAPYTEAAKLEVCQGGFASTDERMDPPPPFRFLKEARLNSLLAQIPVHKNKYGRVQKWFSALF